MGAERSRKENKRNVKRENRVIKCIVVSVDSLNYRLWHGSTSQWSPLPCCAHHGKNYFSRSCFSTCTLCGSYGSTGHLSRLVKPDKACSYMTAKSIRYRCFSP